MDDKKNKTLFRIISEDCEWKNHRDTCTACDKVCRQEHCMPFKFSLFFNRPEVQG